MLGLAAKALVGTGWAISLLLCMDGLRNSLVLHVVEIPLHSVTAIQLSEDKVIKSGLWEQ